MYLLICPLALALMIVWYLHYEYGATYIKGTQRTYNFNELDIADLVMMSVFVFFPLSIVWPAPLAVWLFYNITSFLVKKYEGRKKQSD